MSNEEDDTFLEQDQAEVESPVDPPSGGSKKAKSTKMPASPLRGGSRDLEDLYEIFAEGLDRTEFKISLERKFPKNYNGVPCSGQIYYGSQLSVEDIADQHGGGTYRVRIKGPSKNSNGMVVWATSNEFELPGFPNVSMLPASKVNGGVEEKAEPSVLRTILDKNETLTNQALSRAERIEREGPKRNSMDSDVLRVLKESMETAARSKDTQVEYLTSQLQALQGGGGPQSQILGTITQYSQTQIQTLMESHRMQLESRDQQHQREVDQMRNTAESMRRDHDTRMKDLEDRYRQDAQRHREEYQRDLDRQHQDHSRELKHQEDMLKSQMETLKMSFENRIQSLDREATSNKTEAQLLRRKVEEQGDLATQMLKARSTFEAMGEVFGGEGGSDSSSVLGEDAPWGLKALEAMANTGFASKLGEGLAVLMARGPSTGVPGAPQLPQGVMMSSTSIHQGSQVPTAPVAPTAPRPPMVTPPPQAQPVGADAQRTIEALSMRVEEAIDGGIAAEDFAKQLLAAGLSQEMIQGLKLLGVSKIYADLCEAAKARNPDSSLLSSAGRAFVRAVFENLK